MCRVFGHNLWFGPGIGRSVDDLIDMYYRTVGRGAQLLLNVSPPVGTSMKKATEFGEAIRNAVGHPLATTSGVGDEVVLDLGQTTEIDHVIVREDLPLGQRILKHRIDGFVAGAWKELAAGENLGTKRIYKIKPIVVTKVRVVVTERLDVPQIRSLYVTRTGIKAMDKHPPAPPTGLTGALVDGHTVKLFWTQPATSPDSGIARYAVYLGLAPGYDTFSIAVWVRPDSDDAEKRKTGGGRWETLFSRDRAGEGDYQFRLGLNNWGSPVFVMTPEAERQAIGAVSLLKPVTLPADAWTHLVVTRDAAGVFTLYVDGDSPPPQHAAQQHVQQQKNPEMGHPYNPVANLVLGAQMHKHL